MKTMAGVLLGLLLALAWGPLRAGELTIELTPHASSDVDLLTATVFGTALAAWVAEHEPELPSQPGPYLPPSAALRAAMAVQLEVWSQLPEHERESSRYMNNLTLVANMGYLNEYVWQFHASDVSDPKPEHLDLSAFQAWFQENIGMHVPRIEARLHLK